MFVRNCITVYVIGEIQAKDIHRAMQSLGMELKHKKLVEAIDNHNISRTETDGKMNFEAFLDIVAQNMHENMTKDDTNRVFDFLDRDRNGKISVRDLKTSAQELGEELSDSDLARMIEKADLDRDGEVGPDEFYSIVAKIAFS